MSHGRVSAAEEESILMLLIPPIVQVGTWQV